MKMGGQRNTRTHTRFSDL